MYDTPVWRYSDVNKDWTCKDKDKDFTPKDNDFIFYSVQGLARTLLCKYLTTIKEWQ